MLQSIDPSTTKSWQKLIKHFKEISSIHLRRMFDSDAQRFDKMSINFDDILFDFSKNRMDGKTLELLLELAEETKLKEAIDQLFAGEAINATENRAVLHTALRNQSSKPIYVDGKDVMPDIKRVLKQVEEFSNKLIAGSLKGYTGQTINTIVNIGIGGSDLGPVMVTEALKSYKETQIESYFVSNVDASHIAEVLKKVNAETTLFIIASKTFTTQETMTNAHTARNWLLESGAQTEDVKKHFVAISTNHQEVEKFGIDKTNIFEFWDWVGGRYSLWSSIGLSIACTVGFDHYNQLLNGAHSMDMHFKTTPFDKNVPVLMALIGIWYNNFFKSETQAILPYDQYMHRFSAYFQQGDMESNGKSVDRDGKQVTYQTGPIIWGEPGTNGQHAFFQLIHQGTKLIPCDFLAPAVSQNKIGDHHHKLIANFFAQSEALMNGKTKDEVIADLKNSGLSQNEIEQLVPYKIFDGNRPSNTILFKKLTPYTLGSLIAMYEHKIFVQGVIWNIYSFDQWGVELGKKLAQQILPELRNEQKTNKRDSSTNGLINQFKQYIK